MLPGPPLLLNTTAASTATRMIPLRIRARFTGKPPSRSGRSGATSTEADAVSGRGRRAPHRPQKSSSAARSASQRGQRQGSSTAGVVIAPMIGRRGHPCRVRLVVPPAGRIADGMIRAAGGPLSLGGTGRE